MAAPCSKMYLQKGNPHSSMTSQVLLGLLHSESIIISLWAGLQEG